jgi:hypothetical protein
MRLGLIGSRYYKNRARVLEVLKKCLDRYGYRDLMVVSGGCRNGADLLSKQCAMELGVRYVEFPPPHEPWNEFCVVQKKFYGRPYNRNNFWIRNRQIVEYCDRIIGFVVEGVRADGTYGTSKIAAELGKPFLMIEDPGQMIGNED